MNTKNAPSINPIRWFPSPLLHALFLLLTSFIPAYTIFVFIQPSSTNLSKADLVLALGIWIGLFSLLLLARKDFTFNWQIMGISRSGLLFFILLANLILILARVPIPYTYPLLPDRRVVIQPLTQDQPIQIVSFSSENRASIDLPQFLEKEGWKNQENLITKIPGQQQALVWQGKAGQFIEINFITCETCGKVNLSLKGFPDEEIDLSLNSGESNLIIRRNYPSLNALKIVNLVALELSFFLVPILLLILGRFLINRFDPDWQIRETRKENLLPVVAMKNKTYNWIGRYTPLLTLAVFTIVTYALKIKPILFNDDWCQIISDVQFHILKPFMLEARRPLHLIVSWLATALFPLDKAIYVMLAAEIVILFFSSVFTYFLLRNLFKTRKDLALLAAALWLVFPNDYTYLYISTIGIHLSYLVMLIVMLLTLRLIKSEDSWAGIAAGGLNILGLLMYEGQLGILAIWPILLIVILWKLRLSWRKLSGIAGYYLGIIVFIIWRFWIQPSFYQDVKLSYLEVNPGNIFIRYINALRMILGGFQFPYPDNRWLSLENVVIVCLILVCLGVVFFVSMQLSRETVDENQSIQVTRPMTLALAFILWAAGYFPILLNYEPNIYGHLSRVNTFSNFGAILLLVTLIDMIASGLSNYKNLANMLTRLIILGLVVTGAVIQLQVQESYNGSWAETRAFYRALFEKVPDIAPDTHIIVLFSGYETLIPPRRTPFTTSWEAVCAMQVLYDQASIKVNYRYDLVNNPSMETLGVLSGILYPDTIGPITDPKQLLVVHYDGIQRELNIQEDVSSLLTPPDIEAYAPESRILSLDHPIPSRKLVQ